MSRTSADDLNRVRKAVQRFSGAQVGGTVGRLIDDRLQFSVVRLFAPPQVRHAFAHSSNERRPS
jgi:hypothetical protein